MASKSHIKVPKGIATAVAHNKALIKMVDAFLMLKHYDLKGSGCIKNFELSSKKDAVADALNISKRTLYVRIEQLTCAKLVYEKNGHLYLASYAELKKHCKTDEHGFWFVKPKPSIRLEYQIRALIWKENQQKQLWMIKQKLKAAYNRLKLNSAELNNLINTEMEAIKQHFNLNVDYDPACRPDIGISQRTMSARLTCKSHTSGHYWEQRLRALGVVQLVTNRKITSSERSRECPLVKWQNVFYSRPLQSTFVQLPNLVLCA